MTNHISFLSLRSYNTCEKTMKLMENKKKGIKYFMVDNCDWVNSKARLWTLLKLEHELKMQQNICQEHTY